MQNNSDFLREKFIKFIAQTSPEPLKLVVSHAEGIYLYTPEGKKYIDFISGISVSNLGHSNPKIIRAIQEQSSLYLHTMVYGEYALSPQIKYAEKLIEILQNKLDSVYFVNSGSEAVEGALKLAKKYTNRKRIAAFHHSYHGSTHGALSVTGAAALKEGYGPMLPNIDFLNFGTTEEFGKITRETAAVIVELIRGEAGIQVPPKAYVEALSSHCKAVGALLIVDEIQTGFGRTGTLFAHQYYGIDPDILLLGKALGGGMPLGAFIAPKEIMSVLQQDPVLGHITTFGGHPVCCAAGLAGLEYLLNENLLGQLPAKEALIRSILGDIQAPELRGKGLMFAVQLHNEAQVQQVIQICLTKGLIVDWFLHAADCIRIAPPLTITEEELRFSLEILREAIVSTL